MASRFFALLTWAAVAASLAYWGLRWLAPPAGVPANASPVSLDTAAQGDLRRLLTGPASAAAAAPVVNASAQLLARIKLVGVVAPRTPGAGGVVLLSIDGKPPRALRPGDRVDGDLVVKTLSQRSVAIGPAEGDGVITLDLPTLPPPAAGSLPPVGGFTREGAPQGGAATAPGSAQPGNAMPPPPVPAGGRGQPNADTAV